MSKADAAFPHFCPGYSDRSSRARIRTALPSALIVLAGALFSLSCGNSHAILVVNAPSSVVAGTPFSATVTAMFNGRRDTMIDGPIHFTSSDTAAILPTLYVFTPADAGQHSFSGLLLMTPGTQTMTVSDYDATPIAGTVTIVVTATAGGSR